MGGEESGGIGFGRFLPERDGVLNSLLLANVMAEEGKPLGQIVADLQRDFGPHHYGRRDMHIPDDLKVRAIERAKQQSKLGRFSVNRKEIKDGVKYFPDAPQPDSGAEAWILFRASGTEPLLRLYAEAATPELVEELLADGEKFVLAS
jgi:phosphomannomutase